MISIFSTVGLVIGVLMLLAPGARAAATRCRVENRTAYVSYPGLQQAIDAASTGDTIRVKGVCVGNVTIDKDLSLVGQSTRTVRATLDANGSGRPLDIGSAVNVTLTGLLITGGNAADNGGGISNHGTLTLNGSSSVSGNTTANSGGGIANFGALTLNDSSSVSGNDAASSGGGIASIGTVTLNDSSSVSGNAASSGGGIADFGGSLTLNGSSSVSRNDATIVGGGISNVGILTLNGSSSVSDNTAGDFGGGGISNSGTLGLNGLSSVSGNTTASNGGGISNSGTLTLDDSSSVSGNTADSDDVGGGSGGGIFSCSGILNGAVDGGNVHDNQRGTAFPVLDNIAACI